MTPARHPTALAVQRELGGAFEVLEFPEGTRSAADAAAAVGVGVAQIVKSLVFRTVDERPVIAFVSGANQADEKRLSELAGVALGKADAEFVRAATGFAIGGVSPARRVDGALTFIDADLETAGELWAAAGTPTAVFRLTFSSLRQMTVGQVADIARRP